LENLAGIKIPERNKIVIGLKGKKEHVRAYSKI